MRMNPLAGLLATARSAGRRVRGARRLAAGAVALTLGTAPLLLVGLSAPVSAEDQTLAQARDKVKHVVVIMQENRSFDHYFGTFPGADGIPMDANGVPTVCAPDPRTSQCVKPYHDSRDLNYGAAHTSSAAILGINGGRMDGFVQSEVRQRADCQSQMDPNSLCRGMDEPSYVMAYHDQREIPNYWAYAQQYVLQDHLFESVASWTVPSHLYMVSGWSATCTVPTNPMTCRSALGLIPTATRDKPPPYGWTDLTYVLHARNVSWAYYIFAGLEPDCEDSGTSACVASAQDALTPGIFNPLLGFVTVHDNGQ